VDLLEAGGDSLDRLLAKLGSQTRIVRSADELALAAP
jgi:hypothetical protein